MLTLFLVSQMTREHDLLVNEITVMLFL